MIYYRMKFQSVGSAEFNTAYFHALWFYEVDGLVQERHNSISNALELRLSCTNPSKWKHFLHADFHVSLMVARTTFWTNTRVAGELRFHSLWFIHFSRPICMWNSAEIFSWVFPRVQPQYSPKPIQILVNPLRPQQWWLMFGTHFQCIFLTWNWLKFVHLRSLFADWLGYVTIIYYHTNITVASHVHKITDNLTICSIVCSVKKKRKKTNYAILVFFKQIHRLSPVAPTKGQQSGQRSMILQPARTFSTLFFQYSDYTWLFLTIENNMIQKSIRLCPFNFPAIT